MYLYISQELMPQPLDLLSSGGKEKYKRTKDRKTRLSLFSWLSLKMSVCYSPLQGEMTQHGRLAPQNRIWIKCLHLALTVLLTVFMVIRSKHNTFYYHHPDGDQREPRCSMARVVEVSCQSRRAEIYANFRGWFLCYYSTHYLLYSKPVNNGLSRGVKHILLTCVTY